MQRLAIYGHWFDRTAANRTVSIMISLGMVAALCALLVFHDQQAESILLLIAIAVSSLPLLIGTMREVFRLNFSVDILAVLSIVTAMLLQQ